MLITPFIRPFWNCLCIYNNAILYILDLEEFYSMLLHIAIDLDTLVETRGGNQTTSRATSNYETKFSIICSIAIENKITLSNALLTTVKSIPKHQSYSLFEGFVKQKRVRVSYLLLIL